MSKQKILFLAQLPPPVHGVSMMSKQVYSILETIRGCEIDYLWSGGAKSLKDIDKKNFGKIWGFAKLVLILLWRFVSLKRYDIAYLTFAPWTHAAIRDALLARLARLSAKRVLVHLHGEGLKQVIAKGNIRHKLVNGLVRKTELIAITSASADMARHSGIFSQVHLLPNFTETIKRPNTALPEGGGQPLKIGFLGNLDPRKGVLTFLDFIAALKGEGLDIQAEIVGAPTKFLTIEGLKTECRERNIEEAVDVLGPRYDEDKMKFLANIDIFLYPSRHDYAPLVLIEALSLAVVPIVYDTGGIAEMVGKDFQSHVISPQDDMSVQQKQLIDLVQNYISNPELLKQAKKTAYQQYKSFYTKDQFILNFTQILNNNVLEG